MAEARQHPLTASGLGARPPEPPQAYGEDHFVPRFSVDPRELLGRLVRQVWVEWAREQPDPKPSWLLSWEELDDGQREVDMRIGAMLFGKGREAGIDYAETAIAGLHEPQDVRFSHGPRQGRTFQVCPRCSNAAGTAVMVPCPEMKAFADLKAWAAQ